MTQSAPFLVGAVFGMILYFLLFPKSAIFFIRYESSSTHKENGVQELLDEFYREHKLDVQRLENEMDSKTDDKKDLQDNDTIGENFEETVRVHCVVLINEHYGLRLATAVANTWAKRCSSLAFVGRALNQTTPYTIIHSNHSFYTTDYDAKQVQSEAISYVKDKYFVTQGWFLFSTETNFVYLEKLRLHLANRTSLPRPYAGRISRLANGVQSGGILFSKESLRALKLSSITPYTGKDTYELTKGLCLSIKGLIDVTPVELQAESLMNVLQDILSNMAIIDFPRKTSNSIRKSDTK
nr:uncharacterized protein LOC105345780 [Crassostrea gigas]